METFARREALQAAWHQDVMERPPMPTFKIRALWLGPNGARGVADDAVEAADACDALDNAVPAEWVTGQYSHATITIEPLSPPRTEQDADDACKKVAR